MQRATLVLIAVLVCGAAAPAGAETERYAAKVVAADGAAVGIVILGTAIASSGNRSLSEALGLFVTFGIAGVATYAFAPPVIHLTEDQPGRALASFSLRVTAPLAGAKLGDMIDSDGALVGGLAGAAIAMVVDWAVLAVKDSEQMGPVFSLSGSF